MERYSFFGRKIPSHIQFSKRTRKQKSCFFDSNRYDGDIVGGGTARHSKLRNTNAVKGKII